MCGIAGFIGSVTPDQAARLPAMAVTLAHRGPDDEGCFESALAAGGRVGLAHRRLSILDIEAGHQPMASADGAIQLVFNGEIYNFAALRGELEAAGYRFSTLGDTEVIIHAYEHWGEDCVRRLWGMFALALWDGRQQSLLLARDRFGKKPLFIHEAPGALHFASEIKALLAVPGIERAVDEQSLLPYLLYRYVPGPRTMFRGLRKLEPGTALVWQGGRSREFTYYTTPDATPRAADAGEPANPAAQYLALLDDAVKLRMVADVPFGAFLSGGLDSSAVVALMSRHLALPVKTFSVGFAEAAYSELAYAREVAQAFGTDHHELRVAERDLIDQLPALVRFRDAPVSEPSDVPVYLLAREAAHSVKMVLTGEGADETLGGYPKHVYEHLGALYRRLPRTLRRGLVQPLVDALPFGLQRVKTAAASMGLDDPALRMPRWFGALDWAQAQALLAPRWRAPDFESALPRWPPTPGNTPLREILAFDQRSWLPDNLLERGDRMTMAASIEARMPFMDHRLLDLVSTWPDRCRVRGRQTKWVLRAALREVLPPAILERRKVGFKVPVNEWFRHSMRDYVLDLVASPAARIARWFEPHALRTVLDQHLTGRVNHEKLIWALVSLEVFQQEYGL